MDKVKLTYDEYDELVEAGRRINLIADDVANRDQKMKFIMRSSPPTVESLEAHDVRNRFAEFLPMLVYFYEKELYAGPDTDEYRELRRYLAKLFVALLELYDPEDEEDGYTAKN